MSKALADRLAEAFAEMLHEQRPPRLGLRPRRAAHERRPDRGEVPGHPPGVRLPDLAPTTPRSATSGACWTSRADAGIALTESYAMHPGASVSGLYFAHPQARYFAVDLITRDQVENYAARKGMPVPRSSAGWPPTWRTIPTDFRLAFGQ